MGTRMVMVKWDNHYSTLLAGLQQLLFDEAFTDVTLVCEDSSLKTHKVFLVALSCFFKNLFTGDFQNCRIVDMRNIKCNFLKEIITLMYYGEVNVYEDQLPEFFKVAELLQVKGFVENSKFNVSVNKKLVSNEKANVEFIEKTVGHQLNGSDLKDEEEDTISQRTDDELFIDPSNLVKQEIFEGNMPIFPDLTFTEKDFNTSPSQESLLGCKGTCPETDTCSKIQDQNKDETNDILYRSAHLDGQQAHMVSDQCQDTSNINVNLKNTSRKTKRKIKSEEKVQNIADSISNRTRSSQREKRSEIMSLQSEIDSEIGLKETNRTKENSKYQEQQNQDKATVNSHSSLQGKKHHDFTEWFAKVKVCDNKNLQNQMMRTNLSFHEDFLGYDKHVDYDKHKDSVNNDSKNKPCPMHTHQWEEKQKIKLKNQVNSSSEREEKQKIKLKNQVNSSSEKDVYDCDICDKKFMNRFSYLMHLKVHYKKISSLSCNCQPGKHKCKTERKLKNSEKKHCNSKQSYQENSLDFLSDKNMKSSVLVSPFSCSYCGKSFFNKKCLATHIESHNIYTCLQCSKQFTRQAYFIRHQKTHHSTS